MRRRGQLVVAGVVVAAAVAVSSGARAEDDAAQAFSAAAELLAAGKDREAADAFVKLADEHVASRFANDALFAAAELFEQRLGEPQRARDLYGRIVQDYPESRNARAAQSRHSELSALIGGDTGSADALAAFNRIKAGRGERGSEASIADAVALIEAHPDWAGVPSVEIWIADQLAILGELDDAIARYDRVLEMWPDIAAEQLVAGSRRAAIAQREEQRSKDAVGVAGLVAYLIAFAALAALLVHAAGSPRSALIALRHPPSEAIYMLPVAAVLAGVAQFGYEPVARAVAWIASGALAVVWVSGCGLDLRASRSRAVVHAAIAGAAVIALCAFAVARAQLWSVVLETMRYGPDP